MDNQTVQRMADDLDIGNVQNSLSQQSEDARAMGMYHQFAN